jgi:O-antigen/teichoic acid export membrane protein
VLTPLLVHEHGVSGFGLLMLVLLVPSLAIQLDLGLGATAIRELAQEQGDAARLRLVLGEFTRYLAVVGAALSLMVIGASLLMDALKLPSAAPPALLYTCALWAFLSLVAVSPSLLARALQSLRLLAMAQTLFVTCLWLGAWVLLRNDLPLWTVAALGCLLTVIQAGIFMVALRPHLRGPDRSPLRREHPVMRQRFRFAAGIAGLQLASAIFYQGDRFLVSALGGLATGGAYAAVINVANKLQSTTAALMAFLFPHFSSLESQRRPEEIGRIVNSAEKLTWLVVLPCLVPTLLLAWPFMRLWLPETDTTAMATAFIVLISGFAVSATAAPIGNALLARGESPLAAIFSALSAVTLIFGLAVLVPRYGLVGAACAMALASSTSLLFQAVARRRLGIARDQSVAKDAAGMLVGVLVQAVLAWLAHPVTASWWSLAIIAAALWSAFFIARAALRLLTTEERTLFARLQSQFS